MRWSAYSASSRKCSLNRSAQPDPRCGNSVEGWVRFSCAQMHRFLYFIARHALCIARSTLPNSPVGQRTAFALEPLLPGPCSRRDRQVDHHFHPPLLPPSNITPTFKSTGTAVHRAVGSEHLDGYQQMKTTQRVRAKRIPPVSAPPSASPKPKVHFPVQRRRRYGRYGRRRVPRPGRVRRARPRRANRPIPCSLPPMSLHRSVLRRTIRSGLEGHEVARRRRIHDLPQILARRPRTGRGWVCIELQIRREASRTSPTDRRPRDTGIREWHRGASAPRPASALPSPHALGGAGFRSATWWASRASIDISSRGR